MLKESALAIGSRILMAVNRAVLAVLVANFLGPAAQGVLGLALSVVTIGALLGSSGFEVANAHYAGKYSQKTRSLLIHGVLVGLGSGAIVSLGTWIVLAIFSSGYFRHFPSSFLWAIPGAVLGQVLQLYFGGIVVGRRDFAGYFWITVAHHGVILPVLLSLALGHLLTTEWLIPLWAGGTWLGTFVALGRAWRLSQGQSGSIDWQLLKEQLAFSKNAYLNNLTNWLNHRLDLFIVAAFLEPASVGYYSASTTIAEALLYIPKGLGTVILAREAGLGSESRSVSLYKANVLLVGLAVAGLLVLAPFLIPFLLSEAFLPAVPSFQLLLPGVFALSIAIVASNQLFGSGESKTPSIGALLALTATVGLGLLLIPSLGLKGAAVASSTAYVIYAAYLLRAVSNRTECRIQDLLVPSQADLRVFARKVVAYVRGRRRTG